MPIKFPCPTCNRNLTIADTYAGQALKCPVSNCETNITPDIIALNKELSEIEAVLIECENKLKNGSHCVAIVKQRIQAIADPNEIMAKVNAGDKEWLEAYKKTSQRIGELDTIDIKRLHLLRNQHPNDSRTIQLGYRAADCFMKLSDIYLTACEEPGGPDKQEMLGVNKELMSMMFPNWVPKSTTSPPVISVEPDDEFFQDVPQNISTEMKLWIAFGISCLLTLSRALVLWIGLPITIALLIFALKNAPQNQNTPKKLWIVFGISCFLTFLGLLTWQGLLWVTLPAAIILLFFAMKERERSKEMELENRAHQGDIQAMYDLACKRESKGKYDDAVYWYTNAAKNEHADAQYALGQLYIKGKRNLAQAVHWFQKAADQGLADARYALGVCYEEGCGVELDESKAFHWFEKAATQGHVDAQGKLEVRARQQREEQKQQRAEEECRRKREAEEKERRRKQEEKERYKQDILSGRISYDNELLQLEIKLDEFAAGVREAGQLTEQHNIAFQRFLRGDDDNGAEILRKIQRRLQANHIDEVLVKAKKLNEIRWDTRTRQLIENCEKCQQGYYAVQSYLDLNARYL